MAGTDDGNRQVALALSIGDVALSAEQFDAIQMQLNGINGAINKLAENVSEPDTSVANEISLLKHEISVGFSGLQQSIANLNNVIMDRSIDLAKWLAAIALATANPDNNEAAVQAKIDEITRDIRTSTDAVEEAINQDQTK